MALRVHAVLIGILSVLIVTQAAADPPKSDSPASQVESLTAQVRGLLAEPFAPYPDPWKPRREHPKAFCVVPGEKLSYPERLTAMGLAGLANRGGSRLFIRSHFGFNADADRLMTDQDRLICGPSGAGYTHPGEMPNLDWFIGQTHEYLRRTDLNCIGVCADWDERAAKALARGVPESVGFFHGWGEEPNRKMLLAQGKPYVPYWLCLGQPEQSPNKTKDAAYFAQEAAKLRRIVQREGLPCFVAAHLSCYWSTPSDVPKLLEALGGDIPHEVLLPDQFLQTAADYYGDKIVLDPIESVQLMPSTNTSLVLHLTSTRSQATECRVRLEPPSGVTVEPATGTMTIEAFGTAQVPIRLRTINPVGGKFLSVVLDFAGHSLEHKVPIRCLPPVEQLPEGLSLCSVWEAGQLSHNTGAAVDDPETHGGQAWQAVPGKHPRETHLAWGPYEELPPGRYAVAFRLKAERQGEAPVARLDVYNFWLSQEGKDGTYAQRTLHSKDLVQPGRYADHWLDFEHGRTGKVEYRVWWPGNSPLSLDRVVVFRKP